MKKGKELKIEQFKNYNIIYGSVNNRNPKALYINISAWADPKNEGDIRYGRVIREFDKRIRQSLYNDISRDITTPFLKERSIVDFDIRESGIRYGKRSFANCEITLYMKHEIPVNSEYLKPMIDDLINMIVKTNFENSKDFKFYRKKK